jgi:lipopolysaccharide transport system ATP-binding protein
MSRAEIRSKFDEIVAFAEIERFLDTPVKRYSSGMYVRLAFAVAAHLEPEILIVDEVLAVGDAAFQKKCLGKMQDVARTDGRTVLFVSHNLPAVRQFCQSAILLAAGALKASGPCGRILDLYQHGLDGAEPAKVPAPTPDLRTRAYATSMTVETLDGVATDTIPVGRPWRVRIGFRIAATQSKFVIAVGLRSGDGLGVQTAWLPPRQLTPGDYEAEFVQDRVVIEAGTYTVIVGLSEDDRSIQQFEGARIDLVAEGAVGFYVGTSGLGVVLNSMPSSLSKL